MESNGNDHAPIVARLKLTIDGDRMIADFTGTSPQTKGPTNVGPSMAPNAVCTIAKAFLDPKTSINHGSFEPIEVIAPVGSFINALARALWRNGRSEGLARLVDGRSSRSGRTGNDFRRAEGRGKSYVDRRQRSEVGFVSVLRISRRRHRRVAESGWRHGRSRVHRRRLQFGAIDRSGRELASASGRELRHPGNSCGDGKNRGGFGMRRCIRVLSDSASLSILSDRNMIPPYGVLGGAYGAPNHFAVAP
ncbi:MAG: hydantoinase B/oxoprolinase family protein [Rhizobiales bacterium]|nr:hydantoinase B/oxoprolinase family protein [Hyphomicrobiales bacterium]